ncbi:MAG: hypothetical protein J7515_05720 [Caulobacter sp.]|nr:hypothetical protein [Caulobacter sp.]
MWKLVFSILAWMALATSGSAQIHTPAVGGPGGGAFVETCGGGANNFLIGVTGRTGDWIDAIMPICARYDPSTKTLGRVYTMDSHGGGGGSPNSATCPDGMVVKGMDVGKIDNGGQVLVKYVRLQCQRVPIDPDGPSFQKADFFGIETLEGHPDTLTCPDFEAGSGLWGASGDYVDRLGLYCQGAPFDLGRPVPAPSPAPKDTASVRPKPSLQTAPTRAPTRPPLSLGIYVAPRIPAADGQTERLDFCQQWGSACGKPAADAFCKTKGHDGALSFDIDPDIGRTMIIGSGAICTDPTCDGFKRIQCNP